MKLKPIPFSGHFAHIAPPHVDLNGALVTADMAAVICSARDLSTQAISPFIANNRAKMSTWTELYDEGSGQNYYLNTETNEVTWDKPAALESQPTSTALPAGWTELYDEGSGRVYYVNESTNETSWDLPVSSEDTAVPEQPGTSDWIEVADDSGAVYYFNSVTNETTWDRPADMATVAPVAAVSDWVEQFDEGSGRVYYANSVTGATTWDNPNAPSDTGELQLLLL